MTARHVKSPSTTPAGRERGLPPLLPELAVYLALMALGAVSLGLAYLPFFGGFNLSVNLTLAAVMVVIVLAFFMDLRRQTALIFLTAISSVLWLAILFTLTLADYTTRAPGTGATLSGAAATDGSREFGQRV